ncbi:MAG TPA: HEAT repeat domain-containing protein [Anaeromyxobacter sp.]|nr:HEAT repeat domain-containing protein [Anaeromyxobacter sp.]
MRFGPAAAALLLTACAGTLNVPMNKPAPTSSAFADGKGAKGTLKLVDARGAEAATFHVGVAGLAKATLLTEGFDPLAYLADGLGAEFAARGYPVQVTADPAAAADMELKVLRYRIVHRRVNGYSPWESMHQFRGVLTSGGREFPILAYFTNGKVPVWKISEIFEPCVQLPQSILVKEIASKVNRALLRVRASDAVVDEIVRRATPKDAFNDGPFMEIVELAGTNNPAAVPILKRYVGHKDEFVRMVALDAIGILGPEPERAFLQERYTALTDMDKAMALKAIGDIGDEAALAFVAAQASDALYVKEAGFSYLVDLYSGK